MQELRDFEEVLDGSKHVRKILVDKRSDKGFQRFQAFDDALVPSHQVRAIATSPGRPLRNLKGLDLYPSLPGMEFSR
jgi:hypothetical protein